MTQTSARRWSMSGWRGALAYALLWAIAVTGMEQIAPMQSADLRQAVLMIATSLFAWALSGVALLALARLALPRLGVVQLMPVAMLVLLLTVSFHTVQRTLLSAGPTWLVRTDPIIAGPGYFLWVHVVYGGMFIAGVAFAQRAERTRSILARAEIARSRSETLFSQARLASLQGSVDPAFVLRVLDAMQQRYALDAPGADRLLDRLVEFLRLAMPGVRSGRSTLGAELAIVRSYSRLICELEPQRNRWSCDADASLGEMPFPPLLLLPLLDRMSTRGEGVALVATRGAAQALLSIHGPATPDAAAPELLHRLRVGLHAAYGTAAQAAAVEDGAQVALTISLPLADAAPHVHDGRVPSPDGDASCQSTATTIH
jgi:hypothetical protein